VTKIVTVRMAPTSLIASQNKIALEINSVVWILNASQMFSVAMVIMTAMMNQMKRIVLYLLVVLVL